MPNFSIAATGQALLHGAVSPASPGYQEVRAFLAGADVALANFEAVLAVEGAWPTKTKTLHCAAPAALHTLKALGFAALTHANNHAFDLGPPGILATHRAAGEAGVALVGSGEDAAAALRPAYVATAAGTVAVFSVDLGPQPDIAYAGPARAGICPLRMRRIVTVPEADYRRLGEIVSTLGDDRREAARLAVGYRQQSGHAPALELFGTELRQGREIGARWEADAADLRALLGALAEARAEADLCVIALHSHHWDPNWGQMPDWVQRLGAQLVDAGADMIVGTGSPVLQGLSFHNGRPILGSLGNFIFHTRRTATYAEKGVDVWTSTLVRAHFDAEGACCRFDLLPVSAGRPPEGGEDAPSPTLLAPDAAEAVREHMSAGLGASEKALIRLCRAG
jgi:poly-gamma-glutamate synthesis protein (capsule biosynthesis protein)